jgi:hypothetical protein
VANNESFPSTNFCELGFPFSFSALPTTYTRPPQNAIVLSGFAVRGASAIMEGVRVTYLVPIPASTSEAKLTLKANASTLTEKEANPNLRNMGAP